MSPTPMGSADILVLLVACFRLLNREMSLTNQQRGWSLDHPLSVLVQKLPYSNTKIFFPAHISFRTFGHTVTLTSPKMSLAEQ